MGPVSKGKAVQYMTNAEYREWLITEILQRKAWCKRNKENADTLRQRPTKTLETIYDRAK